MISNYKDKKLIEYLKPGMKVLIRFAHGWGDTLFFMPIFEKLKKLYPDVKFDIYLESGQEKIFKSYPDKDSKEHDLIFHLDFPMSEGSDLTKAEKCCVDEIGIEPIKEEVADLPSYPSPLVAVHFQGTALPEQVSCPPLIAGQIWTEIKKCGLIPIECHFEHAWHNPINQRYFFVDSSVRGSKACLKNLIGLLQHCRAFIGVASGPFVTALSIMPDRMLFLEKYHKLHNYTHKNISKVDILNYQPGSVKKWLNNKILNELT